MTGIFNGMVMQRNDRNVSEILVTEPITSAAYSGGQLTWEKTEGGYLLTGIPVGGPYAVTVNGETFSDIYVGDVWVLAGQSNMEGVGWLTQEDRDFAGDPEIRNFAMDDRWCVARHRLHRPWLAVDKVHTEVIPCNPGNDPENRGVGPGLAFAQHMKEVTGVPQGLICCAHGGTTLEQWDPALQDQGGHKSLFAAMVRRFRVNGSHVKGIFWYQGCSEAMSHKKDTFTENTVNLFAEMRKVLGQIPIVQVQIANVTVPHQNDWNEDWSSVREQQRRLAEVVPMLDTISAIGMDKDDAVHLSSLEQQRLGKTAAESMCALLYKDKGYLLAPTYKKHTIHSEWLNGYSYLDIEYDNVYGQLQADGKPYGFAVSTSREKVTFEAVCKVTLQGNHVHVRLCRPVEQMKGWYLFYGFGENPYCNITDGHGRRIPAMGPIEIQVE